MVFVCFCFFSGGFWGGFQVERCFFNFFDCRVFGFWMVASKDLFCSRLWPGEDFSRLGEKTDGAKKAKTWGAVRETKSMVPWMELFCLFSVDFAWFWCGFCCFGVVFGMFGLVLVWFCGFSFGFSLLYCNNCICFLFFGKFQRLFKLVVCAILCSLVLTIFTNQRSVFLM